MSTSHSPAQAQTITVGNIHPSIAAVTERIVKRSTTTRATYLANLRERLAKTSEAGPKRGKLGCANLAHACAAAGEDQNKIGLGAGINLGIVTAYNDMLSAHQPYETYPETIRAIARSHGGTAQVAGGVPAMCDGVTQGYEGMELSLFSRDVIAMACGVALSHETFDAALYLGICDKIVPGLLIGALTFGYLPGIFIPSGPMTTGISNDAKRKARDDHARGLIGREELLKAEMASYHGPGTCTFYGTANSNQMVVEMMGLQLPGSSFVNPGTPLRAALTAEAVRRALEIAKRDNSEHYRPLGLIIDERSIVNAIVGLCATGGSTNLVLHLTAVARAAGIILSLDDFSNISEVTPLLARVYPNGSADVNQFHAAGGMPFLTRALLQGGFLHASARGVFGQSIVDQTMEPYMTANGLQWREGPTKSGHPGILRDATEPFDSNGGLKLLSGNLGRGLMKISAVKPENRTVTAPAMVFNDQAEVQAAFKAGQLNRDVVVVVRWQGPAANGMPELHKLTTPLSVLQDAGHRVALLTDGRMSGASGKVPTAIHVSPEASREGRIGLIENGDIVTIDAVSGVMNAQVASETWDQRRNVTASRIERESRLNAHGAGRELFKLMRAHVGESESGACTLF